MSLGTYFALAGAAGIVFGVGVCELGQLASDMYRSYQIQQRYAAVSESTQTQKKSQKPKSTTESNPVKPENVPRNAQLEHLARTNYFARMGFK